jgi:hypothetical protein
MVLGEKVAGEEEEFENLYKKLSILILFMD